MTKLLIAISLCAAFAITHAADKPATAAANEIVKGEVLETMDSGGFTYMRLKSKDGELWTAVRAAPVKVGSQVTVENAMTMKNFESKTLKRTFASIVLGDLAGAPKGPHGGAAMAPPHVAAAKAPEAPDVKVDKAKGANARTVAEVNTKSPDLKDKPVVVRGKVVKYNGGIMGKNWVHLRDGSGSAADSSNDIIVTTADQAKVGDVVNAEGVVRTESLVWVGSKPALDLYDFGDTVPLALSASNAVDHRAACEAMARAGLRYKIAYASNSLAGLIAVARSGLAISVMAQEAVPSDLHILPLPALPRLGILIAFADAERSPAVEAFANHIRSVLPSL